jgi:hypothetical protein
VAIKARKPALCRAPIFTEQLGYLLAALPFGD